MVITARGVFKMYKPSALKQPMEMAYEHNTDKRNQKNSTSVENNKGLAVR